MLHECVPVVTNRVALPEVVGNTGLYLEFEDVEGTAKAVLEALQGADLGRLARKRIVEQFNLARRARAIDEILASLL